MLVETEYFCTVCHLGRAFFLVDSSITAFCLQILSVRPTASEGWFLTNPGDIKLERAFLFLLFVSGGGCVRRGGMLAKSCILRQTRSDVKIVIMSLTCPLHPSKTHSAQKNHEVRFNLYSRPCDISLFTWTYHQLHTLHNDPLMLLAVPHYGAPPLWRRGRP